MVIPEGIVWSPVAVFLRPVKSDPRLGSDSERKKERLGVKMVSTI